MKHNIISLFILLAIPVYSWQARLQTLQEAQYYAAEHEEYPDADNNDWLNADYTSFYQSLQPSFFTRVLRKVGLRAQPLWQPQDFKDGLARVMALQPQGYELIGGIVAPENETLRFVIWNDLHGAYHSFVRTLTDLRAKNIIDDHFNIIAKNTYFIINGNVICGSPYILQTLTLIFSLIIKNPANVIYQRGSQQNALVWENCGVGNVLKELCGIKNSQDPLFKALNVYTQTQPFALYIRDAKSSDVVRISPFNKMLNEEFEQKLDSFGSHLEEGKFFWYSTLENKIAQEAMNVRAIIEGYGSLSTVSPTLPLAIDTRDAIRVYHLLSSQTRAYREVYRFFYDAYGIVTVHGSLQQAAFALISRDVRTQQDFSAIYYELLTGKKVKSENLKGIV